MSIEFPDSRLSYGMDKKFTIQENPEWQRKKKTRDRCQTRKLAP